MSPLIIVASILMIAVADNSSKYVVSIDGCVTVDQMCERTAGLIGNISCLLMNTKLNIELTFRLSESSGAAISREWHFNDEDHSTNTFDNCVISEYHISQCDEVIKLSCSPASVGIAKFQNTDVIHLKPDASECQVPKNGSKTVTADVIIVCVLMISVLAATFFINRIDRSQSEPCSSGMKMSQTESQDTDTAELGGLISNFLRERKPGKLEDYLAAVKTINDEFQMPDEVFGKLLSVALEYEEINVKYLIQGITDWGKKAVISSELFLSFMMECAKCDKINTQNLLEEVKTWRRENFVDKETIFKFTMSLRKENLVDKEYFLTFTMSLLKEDVVDKESFLTFTMSLLKEDLVDKEYFLAFTISLLKEDLVEKETFYKFTTSLLKDNLVDKESFFIFTMSLLKEDLVDKESFLTFTMSLLNEGLIDESTALPII